MASAPVLLATAESASLRALLAQLNVDGREVTFVDTPERVAELLQEHSRALALVDLAQCPLSRLQKISSGVGKRLILLSEEFDRDWVTAMLGSAHFGSLIARSGMQAEELAIGVGKLLKRDLFGIDKYLGRGATIEKRVLFESGKRIEVFDEIVAFLESLKLDERIVSQAVNVADELITNALYNAPVGAVGERPYRTESRLTPLQLPTEKPVEVCWAYDGLCVAIAVSDYYGSLERRTLIRYLAKGFPPRELPNSGVRVKAALFTGGYWRHVDVVNLSSREVKMVGAAGTLPGAQVGSAARLEIFEGGEDGDVVADCRIVERTDEGGEIYLVAEFEAIELSGGGSGTGLSTAYRSASKLIVNVVPGRKTECIGIIDVKGTYRQIVTRGRSINLFYLRA